MNSNTWQWNKGNGHWRVLRHASEHWGGAGGGNHAETMYYV